MFKFDFAALENEDFKEDSVREFVVAPLLQSLGFVLKDDKNPSRLQMILSKRERADFKIGSNKKIEADLMPDYALYVDSKIHCVLDAKAPKVSITKNSEAEKQVLSYVLHFKSPLYALCNGHKFLLFEMPQQNLLLDIDLKETTTQDHYFLLLKQYLTTPIKSLRQTLSQDFKKPKKSEEWYLSRELPKAIINPKKQAMARYFGCTAYFTRQSWDVVERNIKNFTDVGDVVLDPFGGSGVTAIEAMMNGRIGIHVDLNPLSVFMAKALSAKVDLGKLYDISEEILSEFENLRPKNEREARNLLKHAQHYPNAIDSEFGEVATQKMQDSTLWIPKDEPLPKGSDVDSVLGLFSNKQLTELAILRKLIFKYSTPSGTKEQKILKRNLRYALMLGFYNTLSLINLTYHETESRKGSAGNYFAFYYRYRLAKKPTFLDVTIIYRQKIKRVLKGKRELENAPSDSFYQSYLYPLENVIKDFKGAMLSQRENLAQSDSRIHKSNGERIFQADATNLQEIETESVDFIYTDPPYGAKIPYLDLSTMWNAWLDFPVDFALKEKECIEKGSLEKSRYEYYDLMKASLKEMYRVLKWNRWLAFVFQHEDIKLWQILRSSAEEIGFTHFKTMRQSNGQTTFKKRQKPFSVLSGQLIVYFKKIDNKQARIKQKLGFKFSMLLDIAKNEIIKNNGATLDEICSAITETAMNEGFLDEINDDADMTIIPYLTQNLDYDEASSKYHVRDIDPHRHFEIPLEVRTEYFLKNYFNKCKTQKRPCFFDDICLEVIPKLSNGIAPDSQYIKDILNKIAIVNKDTGEWHLKSKKGMQGNLFHGQN